MAGASVLVVADGLSEHIKVLYPVVDVSGLPAVEALHVKTHTDGMRLFAWAFLFLPEWLEKNGNRFRGYSLRQSQTEWLLVARIDNQGIPQVAFFTGSNPMYCIRLFQDAIARGGKVWYSDKYA